MSTPLHTTKETLGERVRRFRTEREMSQEKLAELCGFTNGWISKLEKDKYWPSPELITKLAAAFKIPVHELLQEEDKRMELVSRIKLVEVLLERNQSSEAERYIVDLESHPELTQKDKMTLAVHLAECRYQQKEYDEVFLILQPIIDKLEAENYHDAHMLAWIRNKIGNAYTQKQDTTNAYYNYKKALDYSTRFPVFDQLAAFITYNVGLTLRRKGRSSESLEYLETASEHFKNTSDLRSYAHSLFVQGVAFQTIQDYEKASDLLTQTLKVYQSLNHASMCHAVQVTLASNVVCRDNPSQALDDLYESLSYYYHEKDYLKAVFVLSKIVSLYIEAEQHTNCQQLLQKGISLISDLATQHCHEVGDFYQTFARYCYRTENLEGTISYGLKSAEIYGTLGMLSDQVDSLEFVVHSYRDQRNFEQAFYFQTFRNDLLQSLKKG